MCERQHNTLCIRTQLGTPHKTNYILYTLTCTAHTILHATQHTTSEPRNTTLHTPQHCTPLQNTPHQHTTPHTAGSAGHLISPSHRGTALHVCLCMGVCACVGMLMCVLCVCVVVAFLCERGHRCIMFLSVMRVVGGVRGSPSVVVPPPYPDCGRRMDVFFGRCRNPPDSCCHGRHVHHRWGVMSAAARRSGVTTH